MSNLTELSQKIVNCFFPIAQKEKTKSTFSVYFFIVLRACALPSSLLFSLLFLSLPIPIASPPFSLFPPHYSERQDASQAPFVEVCGKGDTHAVLSSGGE